MSNLILIEGAKERQGNTPPDGPFTGDICDTHIVDATPANMGKVVFNQCCVVRNVELLVRVHRYARGSTGCGRAGER